MYSRISEIDLLSQNFNTSVMNHDSNKYCRDASNVATALLGSWTAGVIVVIFKLILNDWRSPTTHFMPIMFATGWRGVTTAVTEVQEDSIYGLLDWSSRIFKFIADSMRIYICCTTLYCERLSPWRRENRGGYWSLEFVTRALSL